MRRIEWHEAPSPDGHFRRLPLADVVCTINLGVIGRYRLAGDAEWHGFPRIAGRGISSAPSHGCDPAHGAIGYVSVVIAPWAVPIYTGVSAASLADRIVDLADAAPAWRTFETRLQEQPDGMARVQWVAATLATMAAQASWSPRVATLLDAVTANRPIGEIAADVSLSMRRVHQLCVAHTGHRPSLLRQIARFGRLVHALHADGYPCRWSEHVGEYVDHSHAIREFRRWASLTPRRYAASRCQFARTYSIAPRSA